MGLILTIILTILFAVTPVMSEPQKTITVGEPQSGIVCMTNMKAALEPSTSSLRKVVISSTDDFGEKVQYVAGQAYKNYPDGKRMVLTMLEPEMVKGTSYLFKEKENRVTEWFYLPFLHRVREVKPIQSYDSFLGTDFTISDIGLISLPKVCELVEVANLAGVKAYKVEEKVTGPMVLYSRIVTWIAADLFLPIRRDYYDEAGRLWMTLSFKEVTVIDKVPTPLLIEMKNVQEGSFSTFKITNVVNNVDIPNEFFDPKQLSKVANSPLWKLDSPKTTK